MMSKDTKHARIINIKGMLNIGCPKCLSKQNYALCNIGLKICLKEKNVSISFLFNDTFVLTDVCTLFAHTII